SSSSTIDITHLPLFGAAPSVRPAPARAEESKVCHSLALRTAPSPKREFRGHFVCNDREIPETGARCSWLELAFRGRFICNDREIAVRGVCAGGDYRGGRSAFSSRALSR